MEWSRSGKSLLLTLTLVGGCDKTTDPTAQGIDSLKYPYGLQVQDLGNGSVKLSWRGSNNEDDFTGYNIYGVEGTASSLGVSDGVPIKLLDDEGEAIADAKKTLAKFHYSPDAPFKAQAEPAAKSDDDEKDFVYLPIHSLDSDKDPILPTCQTKPTSGVATRAATTEAGTSLEGPDDGVALNGRASYTVSGLAEGTSYCFLVLATMDSAKEVSSVTSEVRCIVPRYRFDLGLYADVSKFVAVHLDKITTQCAAGTCPTLSSSAPTSTAGDTDYRSFKTTALGATSTTFLQTESYTSTGDDVYVVAGATSAIQDLGYYASGLDDDTLPRRIPSVTWDGTGVQNTDGYSVPGQSVLLLANHVYAVARAKTAEDAGGTDYYYDLFWVKSTDHPTRDEQFTVEVLLASKINER